MSTEIKAFVSAMTRAGYIFDTDNNAWTHTRTGKTVTDAFDFWRKGGALKYGTISRGKRPRHFRR